MSEEGGVMSSEAALEVARMVGNTHLRRRGSGHSVVPRAQHASRLRAGIRAGLRSGRGCRQTMRTRGVCAPALELQPAWEGLHPENGMQSRGQNRTREIRPSGIIGGPVETWPMVELGTHLATERARLETLRLRVRAPQIYPDNRMSGLTSGTWRRSME